MGRALKYASNEERMEALREQWRRANQKRRMKMIGTTMNLEVEVTDSLRAAIENSVAMIRSFIENEEQLKAWEEPHHVRSGYEKQVLALTVLYKKIWNEEV